MIIKRYSVLNNFSSAFRTALFYYKKVVSLNSLETIVSISFLVFFVSTLTYKSVAQTDTTGHKVKYKQFTNELTLSRIISKKWSADVYIGSSFSDTPEESFVFKTNTQRYISTWANYYASPRWKLSSSLAFFYNADVPEIKQYNGPQWWLNLQATYWFHKIGFDLSARTRGEWRFVKSKEGEYNDLYRVRQQLKYIQPLNGKLLREGVFYLTANDELWLRYDPDKPEETGIDRNHFEVGAGYLFTDSFILELSYINEYLPRTEYDEIDNCLFLSVTFNNLGTYLKKRFSKSTAEPESDE